MFTINSYTITVASQCSQQATVKISYHLHMYRILYKNDKLARSILVKIVNHIEKCQTTDYIYFSQLHISAILLYKNFHSNMLHIFISTNFLRNYHLLINKQKDHIQIKFTASSLFLLASAYQYKTHKIGITILGVFQLKISNLQNYKHTKSIYLNAF